MNGCKSTIFSVFSVKKTEKLPFQFFFVIMQSETINYLEL